MTIEQTDVIDFVAFDKEGGDVSLVIADHLVWDENEGEHLLLLQDKLNAYLQFVESGQLYSEYPKLKGRNVVIELSNKYPLSEQAKSFFKLASAKVSEVGIKLLLTYPGSD